MSKCESEAPVGAWYLGVILVAIIGIYWTVQYWNFHYRLADQGVVQIYKQAQYELVPISRKPGELVGPN